MRIQSYLMLLCAWVGGGRYAFASPQLKPIPSSSRSSAGGDTTIYNRSSKAFTFPAPNLDASEFEQHAKGDKLFEANFVSAPAPVNPGLGPVFNNASCLGCHTKNGRGMPLVGATGTLRSQMLVRVSLEDGRERSYEELLRGPIPVPGFGLQIQDHAIYGRQPEAKVEVSWQEEVLRLDDGVEVLLRRPLLSLMQADPRLLAADVRVSLRQTPPVFGTGLLEAVSEEELLSWEDPDDADGDGISGRAQRVWDAKRQEVRMGRFGWKAGAPDLLVQTAAAFAEDMGLSNPLFPEGDASFELSETDLVDTAFYMQTLAVPAAIAQDKPEVQRGAALFTSLQCGSCHRPQLSTDPETPIKALRQQSFQAYTDLLLHDMGEGLADHRQDHLASGREWRTPPLWGLGLTHTVLPRSGFLHDGRARTLEEAILWHGGEAAASQKAYRGLTATQRSELLAFLKSL